MVFNFKLSINYMIQNTFKMVIWKAQEFQIFGKIQNE